MLTVPHSESAERSLLGSILHQSDLIYRLTLEPEDFYDQKHQRIYATMREMARSLVAIDIVTLSERLDDSPYYAGLFNEVVAPNNIAHYEKIIKEKALYRRLLLVSEQIKTIATVEEGTADEALAKANNLMLSVRKAEPEMVESKSLVTLYEEAQITYLEKLKNGSKTIGLPTSFDFIDGIIDGLRPGHLWVIGGATSVGKSFFAINILLSLLKQQKRIVFYSLEMSPLDITSRLIGLITGLNSIKVMKGYTSDEEKAQVEEAKNFLYHSDVSVYKGDAHWNRLKLSMLEQHNRRPVDCFFIDYLQQVESDERTHYDTLRVVSKELQSFAQRLSVPIIAFSQLSNDSINSKSETIGYKGSGDIANSADLGLELRLDEDDKDVLKKKYENNTPIFIKLIARKNRHGRMGVKRLLFSPVTGLFEEEII